MSSTDPAPGGQWTELAEAARAAAEHAARANAAHEDLSGRVGALEDLVEQIVNQITDVPAGGPWCWRYLDPYEQVALFHEVRDWVDWMVVRYQVGSVVMPCWYKHGAAIEELTALYVSWRATYQRKPRAYSDDLTAWHDRWFWPCIRRIESEHFFKGCTRLQHDQGKDRTVVTDPDAFATDMSALMDGVRSGMDAEQVHSLLDTREAIALRPKDPTSPIKWGDTWWAILANSPDGLWVPRPEHVGQNLDELMKSKQSQGQRPRRAADEGGSV